MSDLPSGFVLDKQAPAQSGGLPPGFVPDKRPAQESYTGEILPIRHDQEGMHLAVPRAISDLWDLMVKGGKAATGAGPQPKPLEALGMAAIGTPASVARGTGAAIAKEATDTPLSKMWDNLMTDTRGGNAPGIPGPMKPAIPAPGGRVEPLPPGFGGAPVIRQQPTNLPLEGGGGIPGRPKPAISAPGGNVEPSSPYGGPTMQQPPNIPIPGAQGRSGIPGEQKPAIPAPGGRTEPAPTSSLADVLATGNSAKADAMLTRKFRSAVRPSFSQRKTEPAMTAQDNQIITGIDNIIANRANIKLTSPSGAPMAPGTMPQTLRQFGQSISQLKTSLYQAYTQRAEQAGDYGLRVNLAPVVAKIRGIVDSKPVKDFHPELVPYLEDQAARLEARGSYTPIEAQEAIENLNKFLETFYKNPDAQTVSRAAALAPVVRELRHQLNQTVESAGPEYAVLRRRHGALQAIEEDVGRAAAREANKAAGGSRFIDYVSGEEALRGIMTLNPSALVRGAGLYAVKRSLQYLDNPNRAIRRMFEIRAAGGQPGASMLSRVSPLAAPAAARAGAGGAIAHPPAMSYSIGDPGPAGGTITGIRHVRRHPDPEYIEPPR